MRRDLLAIVLLLALLMPAPARDAETQLKPFGRGSWQELTTATFTHDATGRAHRLDRFMGVENGQFFLSHGGFGAGYTASSSVFTRPSTTPPVIVLPAANPPR